VHYIAVIGAACDFPFVDGTKLWKVGWRTGVRN